MGITVRVRGSSGPSDWPADAAILHFDQSGLADITLTRDGKAVYAASGGPGIPAAKLETLEATEGQKFSVILQDHEGEKQGEYPAAWLKVDYPSPGEVAFAEKPPTPTDKGLVGSMKVAKVSGGRVLVSQEDWRD